MPRGSSSSSGPAPQPNSQRRGRYKPKSHGLAKPVTGKATSKRPGLGIDEPVQLIADMWESLQESPESKFYSEPDWHRVRATLVYGDQLFRQEKINAVAWKMFFDGLTELLVSPAAKRRAGIELKPPTDVDEVEADAAVAGLRSQIRAVK